MTRRAKEAEPAVGGLAPTQFRGFGRDARAFLEGLRAENTRAWFEAHRAEYERAVRGPALDLVADLCTALSAAGLPLGAESPARALFRINRDVRFSRDKSPYKVNLGAVLTRTGNRRDSGVLYVQYGLDGTWTGSGFWQPEPEILSALRDGILSRPEDWRATEAALGGSGLALSRDDAAVRLPNGYAADAVGDLGAAIRLRSFVVRRALPDALASGPDLVAAIVAFAAAALPLLRFGWRAIEERHAAEAPD